MNKRKIAIFTGNRAEYGLQLPIIKAIDSHPKLDYSLIVGGAHLEKKYGQTINEIKKSWKRYVQVSFQISFLWVNKKKYYKL